jgi:hypothetical protein
MLCPLDLRAGTQVVDHFDGTRGDRRVVRHRRTRIGNGAGMRLIISQRCGEAPRSANPRLPAHDRPSYGASSALLRESGAACIAISARTPASVRGSALALIPTQSAVPDRVTRCRPPCYPAAEQRFLRDQRSPSTRREHRRILVTAVTSSPILVTQVTDHSPEKRNTHRLILDQEEI